MNSYNLDIYVNKKITESLMYRQIVELPGITGIYKILEKPGHKDIILTF